MSDPTAARIQAEAHPERLYRFMEFCGGHTHALSRYGVTELLPPQVQMIHGPGCPVCVLPIGRLEQAIALARRPGTVVCTFGDVMRVPGKRRMSLARARAEGAGVRMVLGSGDALEFARRNPDTEVVFLAIGFETTTPPTAAVVRDATALGVRNFSVLVNHVLTPPAMEAIVASAALAGGVEVDGFVGPGHVSTIVGLAPYERFARAHGKPVVVAGFEPLDLLHAILLLVRQLDDGRCEVENAYARAVVPEGNRKASALTDEVFELRPSFAWRGLGSLPASALALRPAYAAGDAERRWDVPAEAIADHPACACGEILRGAKKPPECRIFGTVCTPESPVGSCMVSPEGACAAYHTYGLVRGARREART